MKEGMECNKGCKDRGGSGGEEEEEDGAGESEGARGQAMATPLGRRGTCSSGALWESL